MPPVRLRAPAQLRHQLVQTCRYRAASTHAGPDPAPSFLRRYRRAIIWSSLGLAVGWTMGAMVTHTLSPPPFPVPGSHDNAILMHDLEARLDSEFKVKVLRGKCTAAAANLRGDEGAWKELPTGSANGVLVQEALSGIRALGVERVFWNDKEKELVAVVWFGGAMSGWPGVTHGGGIATVLAEKMALAARLAKGGAGSEQILETLTTNSEPKKVEFTYKKPTYANAFYVVRAFPRYGPEYGGVLGSSSDSEIEVDANVETLDGLVCVQSRASIPKAEIKASIQASLQVSGGSKGWIGWKSRSET